MRRLWAGVLTSPRPQAAWAGCRPTTLDQHLYANAFDQAGNMGDQPDFASGGLERVKR